MDEYISHVFSRQFILHLLKNTVCSLYFVPRLEVCDIIGILHFKISLTHWGRVTHIYVSKLTIIGSNSGRRQAIVWTNAGMLLIGPLGTNFSEMLSEISISSLKKIRLKISSAECCLFRLGLNVLIHILNTIGIALFDIINEIKAKHEKHFPQI